jgi:hypothetical protein
MIAIQEITVWDMSYQPNHTYLMDGERAIAYIKSGTTEVIKLGKGLRLDKRGRKFKELKVNPFNIKVKSNLIPVVGSKGNTYMVDPDAKTCTCSGFTFRRTCKHLEMI